MDAQPYWAKPGQAPPAQNPSSEVHPQYAAGPYAQQAQSQVPMAQPIHNPSIPMAQAVSYAFDPQAAAYGYGAQPPIPGYTVQPYGPNGMMGYAGNVEQITVTQPYCGPITCAIGLILCCFTCFGWVVACCPCDTETVTYVNGNRVYDY